MQPETQTIAHRHSESAGMPLAVGAQKQSPGPPPAKVQDEGLPNAQYSPRLGPGGTPCGHWKHPAFKFDLDDARLTVTVTVTVAVVAPSLVGGPSSWKNHMHRSTKGELDLNFGRGGD